MTRNEDVGAIVTTSIRLRFDFDSTSIRVRFDFNSTAIRIRFDCDSNIIRPPFDDRYSAYRTSRGPSDVTHRWLLTR